MTAQAEQLPRGRHRLSREQVHDSQRSRMLDAIANAVADQGYTKTSVQQVIKLAGVSRETFYEHFDDKHDCFLAALDYGTDRLLGALAASSSSRSNGPADRFAQLLSAYLNALADEPLYARTFLVEAFSAGPAAIERRFSTQQRFVELTAEMFGVRNAEQRFACEMLVGAISSMVTRRVATGHADQLPSLQTPIMNLVRKHMLV